MSAVSRSTLAEELPSAVHAVLAAFAVGNRISPLAFADAFRGAVGLAAPTRDVVLGSLMTAVMARGPVADDVVALLHAALDMDGATPRPVISGNDRPTIMLAGSGKKGVRTVNVSTPAALVAAAAGAQVIKVGSSATSSTLGSRDLVRALGLREQRTAAGVRAELAATGFAFVAVEPEIPALDRLYGGRFHVPNPFSFGLGALASPVRADVALFGLAHPRVDVAAETLARFGFAELDVVATRLPSGHYLDEIVPQGVRKWCSVRGGTVGPTMDDPTTDLYAEFSALPTPSGPIQAVERTVELLAGQGIPSHRVLVATNAAHLLVLSGVAPSTSAGFAIADDILHTDEALRCANQSQLAGRSA
ncbi:MAG: hypothetical protein GEV28_16920 [Actinophytocola sp.]|uniref:hypothetical protein n=1 Tax=Actinophytocola sp. TaxID=1872138 RepID=UPI00132A1867|nr:hypothetical protein [Actinophytocola sp.]MPZ81975.1 hypothetical protein [Actinophytocola sp.]